MRDRDLVIWAAETPSGQHRAVFWLGSDTTTHRLFLSELGCEATSASDLWSGRQLEITDGCVTLEVPAHGVVHLLLK